MSYEISIKPMLTVNEVAQLLHIHKNTVRRWSDYGIIKSFRITKRGDRRFRKEDIARFLAEYTDFNANKASVRNHKKIDSGNGHI